MGRLVAHPAGRPGLVVVAQLAVHDEVVPVTGAVLKAAQQALPRESRLCQRPLLRDVLDIGRRLHAIGERGREQVLGQKSLCCSTNSASPLRGEDAEAELQ